MKVHKGSNTDECSFHSVVHFQAASCLRAHGLITGQVSTSRVVLHDGESYKYKKGEYNTYDVAVRNGRVTVSLSHHGYEPVYEEIRIVGAGKEMLFKPDSSGAYALQ